jgi:hypothetical protein
MKTFRFNTAADIPLNISTARKLVTAWKKRRAFPIEILSVNSLHVVVSIDATSKVHNKSVQSLANILQRDLDKRYLALASVAMNEGGAV